MWGADCFEKCMLENQIKPDEVENMIAELFIRNGWDMMENEGEMKK